MSEPIGPEPLAPDPASSDLAAFRARQKARNRAMGLVLGGLAILFFAITIAKLGLRANGAG